MSEIVGRAALTKRIGLALAIFAALAIPLLFLDFQFGTSTGETAGHIAVFPKAAERSSSPLSNDAQESDVEIEVKGVIYTDDPEIIRAAFERYAESARKADSWAIARGYDDQATNYSGISDESLERMANNGDMFAAQMLAMSNESTSLDKASEYYELAARNGSTFALVRLADLWSANRHESSSLSSSKVRALSYALAAQHRGDNVGGTATTRKISSQFEYSDADSLKACEMARTLIDRLAAERASIGMADFDNSRSPYGDTGEGGLVSSVNCSS